MEKAKALAYFGFAKRAGKLVTGVNGAAATKSAYLLVGDNAASPNTKKEIEKLRARFSCPLIWIDELETFVKKDGCKLAAVRDEHLAKAILAAWEIPD